MDSEFLYRYISFETFVGMVQKSALTLVLPSMWDDPQEDNPFFQMLQNEDSEIRKAFYLAAHQKTYAQCWSELAESDAMWRIYAYNNRSVRVKVSRNNMARLEQVRIVNVTYSDEAFDCDKVDERNFFTSLAYKRTAFCHEKEVRLIKLYQYRDKEDAIRHVNAFVIVSEHPDRVEILEGMYPELELEEKIDRIVELLNIGDKCKKTSDISFAHIPDFISGVMVHPLAPEWYVEVVREFCNRNSIPFEGKSELYRVAE